MSAQRLAILLLLLASPALAQDHSHHSGMNMDASGMVMNENHDELPRDCADISRDYHFEVEASLEYAGAHPGSMFGYSQNEFWVEPCSRITVTFHNRDQVRHQWMVHGLPRYLYPAGMFHMEAAGGATQSGTFIVPGDDATYLVHCDVAQHMEKGMKAQLVAGRGGDDLWAIPGLTAPFNRADYLHHRWLTWSLLMLLAGWLATRLLLK